MPPLLYRFPLLIGFLLLLVVAFGTDVTRRDGVIWSDAEGYYMYLPAVFIYGGFEAIPVRTTVQFSRFPGTNKYFTKYTCGVALMQAPFFLAFHLLAGLTGQAQDGYGAYYINSILLAAIVYAMLGFYFLAQVLRRYYSRPITLLTIACLFLGTNMFYYTLEEPGASHLYSFFLFALFLYLTPRVYEHPSAGRIIAMGLLSGLIVLIRPTSILLLLYLLFFDVATRDDLRARFSFLRRHWFPLLLLFPAAAFLVFLPQFAYWKYVSGDWFLYSYGDEGFSNWASPKFFHILFDVKNGWLLFSPILFFSLFGLYQGICRQAPNFRTIAVILGIALYLFASWWMWWFGGGFGYRTLIEFYALLALPFAYFQHWFFRNHGRPTQVLYGLVLAALIYYSLGLGLTKGQLANYDWWTWHERVSRLFPFL